MLSFVLGAAASAGTLPEFCFQPRDMVQTNQIIMFTRPHTQYAARFWITPDAQARLQRFAASNHGQQVVIRYGPSVSVTSRWMVAQATPTFTVSRSSRDEALELASSLGLARDWRLRFGQRSFGLLESPPGRTALFGGPNRALYSVSMSAQQCLSLLALVAALPLLFVAVFLRKRRSNHEHA